jgi:hypothetical protein
MTTQPGRAAHHLTDLERRRRLEHLLALAAIAPTEQQRQHALGRAAALAPWTNRPPQPPTRRKQPCPTIRPESEP